MMDDGSVLRCLDCVGSQTVSIGIATIECVRRDMQHRCQPRDGSSTASYCSFPETRAACRSCTPRNEDPSQTWPYLSAISTISMLVLAQGLDVYCSECKCVRACACVCVVESDLVVREGAFIRPPMAHLPPHLFSSPSTIPIPLCTRAGHLVLCGLHVFM